MRGRNAQRRVLAAVLAAVAVAPAVALAGAAPAQAATSSLSTVSDATVQTNGRVSAVLTVGGVTYLGGRFTSVRPAGAPAGTGEVGRAHLAAVDTATGQLLAWDPGADKEVYTLAASPDGQTVYVGGLFGTVGGQTRRRIAAVSATTGLVTPFTAQANAKVFALYATATSLYAGGSFSTLGGQPRSGAGAVDLATGTVSSAWAPSVAGAVRAITPAPDGSALYLGGEFASVDGRTAQRNLTKVTPTTASPLPWTNHPGYPVWSIVATPDTVYLGGDGSGGHAGSYTSAGVRGWVTQTDGGVQAVALSGGVLYVGGHFDNVCVGDTAGATVGFHCPAAAATRHKILAVDAATGATDPWAPNANSNLGVFALTAEGSAVQVGGDFTATGHLPGKTWLQKRQGFAQYSPTG